MHCRVDIEQAIIKAALKAGTTKNIKPFGINSLLVNKRDFPAKGQTFKIANEKAKDLNERFGDKLSFVNQVKDGHEIVITPSEELIDDYWDGYIKSERYQEQELSGVDRFGDSKPVYSEIISKSSKIDELFPIDDVVSNYEIINLIKEKGALHEKELVEILSPYIDETAPVEFTDELSNKKANGELSYNKGGTTNIKIRNTASGKTTIYLHELAHEVTLRQIDQYYTDKSKLNSEQIEAIKNLINVYEYSKKELVNDSSYGMTNVAEFISEAFSNKKFQDKLNNMEYKNSSIFSKILDYLSQLLGIKQGTALSETLNETIRLASNTTNVQELGDVNNTVFSKNSNTIYSKQSLYFNNRIKRLERELKDLKEGSDKYLKKSDELNFIKNRLALIEEDSKLAQQIYKELGEYTLNKIEDFVKSLESGNPRDTFENIQYSWETIGIWMKFKGLREQSNDLFERLIPFSNDAMVEEVQKHSTKTKKPTLEDINNDNEDIRTFRRWTGSLSDVPNLIGSTIGSIIRQAQNKVETKTKQLGIDIQEEVKQLNEYAKKNGEKLSEVYKLFVQEHNNTLILTKPFLEDGEENPNFTKIQNTPELKKFYDFYKKTILEAQEGMSIKLGNFFIPNIRKTDLNNKIKALNPLKTRIIKEGRKEEDLADIVPLEYITPLSPNEKSTDLGTNLFEFAKFAANYDEMSTILPKVRVLQEQIKYKLTENGIEERLFINPSNPKNPILGEKSNIYKMIDDIIEMQVKGKMKSEQGNIVISDFYDENGDRKQQYIDGIGAADSLLKYNSLLRIGLSPIGASVNWLFGDISNTIESIGGRYFTFKNLKDATDIFFKQNFKKDSVMNTLLIRMNFLQELTDYEIKESIAKTGEINKLSQEKITEIMYSLQKSGEKFLQARTGMAVMIKEGYLTSKGELTDKYNNAPEEEIQQLIDKIQRLNQKIHGRYTQKEAAAAQQNVVYRLISQFRKWIPSAVENRIGAKQWDNRLQTDVEGMYLTFGRLVLKNWKSPEQAFENLLLPLFNSKKLLESGKMTPTEIYNIRKMLVEIIAISALTFFFALLHGGDDEEDKKFRKLAMVKTGLTLLDRAASDLSFFYSPTEVNNLAKNAIPLSKTVGDIIQATTVIPKTLYTGDYTIKKGSSKGQNKIFKEFSDVIPLLKPIHDIRRILSNNDLEELR